MINLDEDSFGQLYSPGPAEAAPAQRSFADVLAQGRMPSRGTAAPAQGAQPAGQSDMLKKIMTDSNRAETSESPWVGQLDPFGDV